MSLFSEVTLKKWQKAHNAFYGDYESLNDIDSLTQNAYDLYSVQKWLMIDALKDNQSYKTAQNFIDSFSLNEGSDTEDICVNRVIETIADILNSPFKSGKSTVREKTNKAEKLKEELSKITPGLKVPQSIINVLNSDQVLKKNEVWSYKQEKADFFENICRSFLSSQGYNAVTTGGMGNIQKNNQQLVTDVFGFIDGTKISKGRYGSSIKKNNYLYNFNSMNNLYKNGGFISVGANTDIGDLISELDELSGNANLSVSVDNELEEAMTQLSALRVQVKSGIGQSILNTNKINAITLSEIDTNGKLQLLFELYNLSTPNGNYYLKRDTHSSVLNNYANTLLSYNISKLHILDEQYNNIYFTEKGFETAIDWMIRTGKYLKFVKAVKLNAGLLSMSRSYNFFSTKS